MEVPHQFPEEIKKQDEPYPVRKSPKKEKSKWRRKVRKQREAFCVIYGLYDQNDVLRYIGQTRQLLNDRLRWFYKQVRDKHKKGWGLSRVETWVEFMQQNNLPITIKTLNENATWDVSEIIYIERARAAGFVLLNMVRGGNDTMKDILKDEDDGSFNP